MNIYKDDDDKFLKDAEDAIRDGNTLLLLADGNRNFATVCFNDSEYDTVDDLLDDIQCNCYGDDYLLFMDNPTIRECRKLDPLIEDYGMRIIIAARENDIDEIICNVDDSNEVILGIFDERCLHKHSIQDWVEM